MEISSLLFGLKKLITVFLLPPGIFIVALLALSWRLWRTQQKKSACYCILLTSLLWLLSSGFMANTLIKGLEKGLTIPEKPNGDVIVLLGGGHNGKAPDLTGIGAPSDQMMARVVTAIRLQRQLHLPILVTGGGQKPEGISEAQIVRRFLLDLGVADRDILMETKSRDTMDNVIFSREILKQHNFKRPLLVTSAFHMRRSVETFRRIGVTVLPVPASFISTPERNSIKTGFFPGIDSLHISSIAMKEYLGLLFYWLKGQRAK